MEKVEAISREPCCSSSNGNITNWFDIENSSCNSFFLVAIIPVVVILIAILVVVIVVLVSSKWRRFTG